MAKSIVKIFSVLLPRKHLRKKIHPYYTIIIKKVKRQITITKKNMPSAKFPKVLCSYAILYNDIILQTSSYKKKSTNNDSTLD